MVINVPFIAKSASVLRLGNKEIREGFFQISEFSFQFMFPLS